MKSSRLLGLSLVAAAIGAQMPPISTDSGKVEHGISPAYKRDKDGIFTDSRGRKYKKHKNGQITRIHE